MKNKNGKIFSSLKKEQLLTENAFIQYCNFDYLNNQKLSINNDFLRAAETDHFIHPLLQNEETIKQQDGKEEKITVNYYSPHQIYIAAVLSKNQINSGLLWASKDLSWYKQHGFRMVNWGWGGMAFTITRMKPMLGKKFPKGYKQQPATDILNHCIDFHNFLKLIHTLENSRYSSFDMQKERHFNVAPSLYFDYLPLKKNPDILERFALSVSKLKMLVETIGNSATYIDPLEHWYYYIHRHPQWRKDLFKGEALLAQELYVICDLLSDVVEAVSGERQPPMFEMLYGEKNIHPYLIPRTEYIHGTDVKSMWVTIKKFKEWMKLEKNSDFVEKTTAENLQSFEKELKEYEDKYGAISFISNGVREVEVKENMKIENLDSKTRQYAEEIIREGQAQLVKSKRLFLSLWDDELEQKIKNKEITLEQAKKEDYDLFVKREIFDAIEQRLSNLKRELWAILDTSQKKISKKVNEAWDIEHNFGNHFWFKKKDELKNLSNEKYHELYQIDYKKAHEEAQYWSKKRDDFGEVEYTMDLLFCSVCRQKPVAIHQSYNDEKISNYAICDDCIKNAKDPKTIKQAELKCDYCGTMLYKYAYQNRLNDLLFNKAPADIDIELEYGRLQVRIKCKVCEQVNRRFVDWGWTA